MGHAGAAVMVVEDELVVASDLQQTLEGMGYDAFATAASAQEACAFAAERWPEVVLMDIRIQGKRDGIRLAKLMKKKAPVIVIFLTAHADEATLNRAKMAAPDGYLVKPVQTSELRCAIEVARFRRKLEVAQEERRQAEARLSVIADNVPVSLAYFDRAGKVRRGNRAFHALPAATVSRMATEAGIALRRASRVGSMEPVRSRFDRPDSLGPKRWEVTHVPEIDALGHVHGIYAIAYDVTEHEQLRSQLQRARLDLETILDATPARITSWNPDLTNRFANEAAELWLGFERATAEGRQLSELLPAGIYSVMRESFETASRGLRLTRDHVEEGDAGPRYWHDEYVPEVSKGRLTVLHVLSFESTQANQSLERIRALAHRLETVREEERRAIAFRLHDGIAQDLYALRLGIDRLQSNLKGHQEGERLIPDLQESVTRCMEDARQIANELRPSSLLHFGLAASVEQYCQKFSERVGLSVYGSIADRLPDLDEARGLLFFRAAQEALTNVSRHAKANVVKVTLGLRNDNLVLEVADDGVGIAEGTLRRPRSLGLLALRERFEAFGGGIDVTGRRPTGTVVTFHLPMPAAESAV